MRWSSPLVVVGAILLVIAVQVFARLLAGPSLGVDDAEQALFAQAWSLNYRLSHPPLYTWLAVALDRTVGLSMPVLTLLRMAILAALWLLFYALALMALQDRRLAALAAAGYALIFKLTYEAQTELAHALLGAMLIGATLVVFAALVRRPSTGRYLLLGVVFALGLLAKWNTGIFIAALLAGALLRPDLRPLVVDRRMGLALGLMTLLIAPSAIWIAVHWEPQAVESMVYAAPPSASSGFAQLMGGLGALALSAVVFPQPFLLAFLGLFGTRLERAPIARGGVDARLLATACGLALVPFALMVPLLGVASFPERWMLVTLLPLPVVLFGFLRPETLKAWQIQAWLGLAALAVMAAVGVRIGSAQLWTDRCDPCRNLIDFPVLAVELREAGFEHGTIVVAPGQFHLAGNLRLHVPGSRLIDPSAPPGVFPPQAGNGQCLLVRRGDSPGPARLQASLRGYAAQELGVPPLAAWQTGRIRVPLAGARARRYLVDFDLLEPGAGDCR